MTTTLELPPQQKRSHQERCNNASDTLTVNANEITSPSNRMRTLKLKQTVPTTITNITNNYKKVIH